MSELQNQSVIKIIVSFLVFLLGTKFTPHQKYEKKTLYALFCQTYETLRKTFWKNYFLVVPQEERYGIPLDFFVKKKTDVTYEAEKLRRAAKQQAEKTYIEFQQSWSHTSKFYLDKKFWVEILKNTSDCRYVLCDKNLGGEFIDKQEYFELTRRELRNYEEICELLPSNRTIEGILRSMVTDIGALLKAFGEFMEKYDMRIQPFTNIRDIINFCHKLPLSTCNVPQLKLLIKKHKAKKEGHWQTRPIIPNTCLPIYQFAKFLGNFLARLQKLLPWVLEDSRNFRTWLLQSSRGFVSTYDFTNLYGTEKTAETLILFDKAIKEFREKGIFVFESEHDEAVFVGLLKPLKLPSQQYDHMQLRNVELSALSVMTYLCIKNTTAVIETDDGSFHIARTKEFLAMGSPPVAPLSNITLAYLEWKKFGWDKCVSGMRRLIDDIALDQSVITQDELMSAYPDYLTLNEAGSEHFLDVSFRQTEMSIETWPYVKPFAVIPLNIASAHTQHTKIAAAKGELKRLLELCSRPEMWNPWIDLWKLRYGIAGYDTEKLASQVLKSMSTIREKRKTNLQSTLIHVETWNGSRTSTHKDLKRFVNSYFEAINFENSMTAWSQQPALSNILLGCNPKPKQLKYDPKIPIRVQFSQNR